jgi:vacuolar-type H+-ATPase subunit I/STV1
MTNDRNYLRMLSDSELVRTALDRNHELAVVLAERLAELLDVEDQLEAAKREIDELNASRDHWQAEANMLQASLDRIDAE